MVVLAIVGVLAVLAIVNQNTFNKSFLVTNTVYDLGLTLRSVETFGLSNKALNTSTIFTWYGIHFDAAHPNSFFVFADTTGGATCSGISLTCHSGDGIYQTTDPIVQQYQIGNGVSISSICTTQPGNAPVCTPTIGTVDVVYTRPFGQTLITSVTNGGPTITFSGNLKACITLTSASGGVTRPIEIFSVGNILLPASVCL